MAVSRPDGLPLYGENLDYNSNATFTGDTERLHVTFASFQHADRDIALDLLSTNRRLETDLTVPGTVIVAGATPDSIQIIITDCTIPPVGNDVQIDLRHVVVKLRLGSPFDMGCELPHRTSPSASPRIPWSRHYIFSAEPIGMKSTRYCRDSAA